MVEVRARVKCSSAECTAVEEYWAVIDVTEVDDSDTFGEKSKAELTISPPEGWSRSHYGAWTNSYYCRGCVAEMTPAMRQRVYP